MNYLTSRSLYDVRYKYRKWQPRDDPPVQSINQHRRKTGISCVLRTPDPKLKTVTLVEIDPRRNLVDHVVLGCSATYPFYLISLYVPTMKYSADESLFSSSMDDPREFESNTTVNSGLAYFWKIKLSSRTIDYDTPPRQLYLGVGACAAFPVLAAFSAWSLSDNSLIQVVVRGEAISPIKSSSSSSWSRDADEDRVVRCRAVQYDRESIEFRCNALERFVVCAGTGELDHGHSRACFDLLDKFGIIALSLNSRVFIYHRNKTPAVKTVNLKGGRELHWHLVPESDIEFQSTECTQRPSISVVELDYFISDNYTRHFIFPKKDINELKLSEKNGISFDEFAIRSLKAVADGYELVFGSLDTKNALYIACALHLNVLNENITVQKVYRSDVSKFRGLEAAGKYNAHVLLNLALQSQKFRLHPLSTTPTSCPNVKKLETYRKNMTSLNQIELYELDMILRSS
ncbi:uncharacterized protein V1513DRAFT_483029 [Lipomyces chichibuensis]|uniref:uncharacterized protein n=1 Tax=Lipomyces chichibuensis TaxID=1546026 RepID=UPI0033431626